ncbi:FtsX-like permease family protein [Nonomuraea zeae]|uniref:FtsX-like permease family protein n=1 Tax=Nonomuraea zeae TaxID=1642303 RepID=A0A5S4GIG7_9ACTN|nr:FtsX-like permease family protein [Nonomuraea zeae]TMR32746.1 FtsX-like permease family protein [Nonomuraea zeae]
MSAFRAALRISRRDAWRSKGRSALVMVLIGLPVLAITALLTGAATTSVNPQEKLPSLLGSADARLITAPSRAPVEQDYSGQSFGPSPGDGTGRQWTVAELGTLIKGRFLRWQNNAVEVRVTDVYDRTEVLEVDLRDPMTRGMRPLVAGRYAAAPGEAAVSRAMLDRGARIGGTIKVTRRDRPVLVVGVIENPNRPGLPELAGLPEGVLSHQNDGDSSGWLVQTPDPVDRAEIRRLNRVGLAVSSRHVTENATRSELARADTPSNLRELTSLGIMVVLAVMETVLLAGPAFAVGLRRRRRELAVLAAQGASGRQLGTIVLADGLVLGGAAALLGAALGIGAGALGEALLARSLDWTHGPVEVPWPPVLGVAALGVVSGLTAAIVPAIQAARQRPAQVLAGRASTDAHKRAGRPVLGFALVLLGLGATYVALRRGQVSVASSALLLVLGLVALMPWLVQASERLAGRLPLPVRLSVRDASRHRVRTASAAAAVMAATMVAVTVGIGVSSSYAKREAKRDAVAPTGTLAISGRGLDDQGWARLRAEVGRRLPAAALTPGQEAMDARGRGLALRPAWDHRSCRERCVPPGYLFMSLPIGDERLLTFLQRRHDPQAAAALAAGKAVAFNPEVVRDGMIELDARDQDAGATKPAKVFKVPAVVSSGAEPTQTGALIPASAVRAAGLDVAERAVYTTGIPADLDSLDRLGRDLRAVSGIAFLDTVEGPDDGLLNTLLVLLGAALVVVLGGTFAATGLAAADMRQDLDTLSAVGGPSRTRRLVVAAQAGYIALLGALVGLAGGAVSGLALSYPLTREFYGTLEGIVGAPGPVTISIPWLFLAGVVLGLPLLAALLAGLVTRTRPVLARRVA